MKRYKATKDKLKRQKEQMLYQAKKKTKLALNEEELKKLKDKRNHRTTVKSRIKEMNDWNNEHAKKIKEVFRSSMATTVVSVLNAYRKPDCKEGRITNTEDFKHLARKVLKSSNQYIFNNVIGNFLANPFCDAERNEAHRQN